jgi:hypothetical protein
VHPRSKKKRKKWGVLGRYVRRRRGGGEEEERRRRGEARGAPLPVHLCPHATIYVSSYHRCVLMLLYVSSYHRYVFSYYSGM